jgi:hypothetical protein
MEEGEADCVGFSSLGRFVSSVKWGGTNTVCSSSTVTKDGQGNEHLMIQFNVSGTDWMVWGRG